MSQSTYFVSWTLSSKVRPNELSKSSVELSSTLVLQNQGSIEPTQNRVDKKFYRTQKSFTCSKIQKVLQNFIRHGSTVVLQNPGSIEPTQNLVPPNFQIIRSNFSSVEYPSNHVELFTGRTLLVLQVWFYRTF